MTAIGGINHVTLCCSVEQLPRVEAFYKDVLGLQAGARPAFDFPGTWLYAGAEPIIHLAATLRQTTVGADQGASAIAVTPGGGAPTGPIDHVALRVTGALDAWRQKLVTRGIRFAEAPVPGFPLHQVFLHDPLGVRIELNFEVTR